MSATDGSSTITAENRRASARVALDLAVLGERRRADHPQFAAGKHRLEDVGGVHRALGVAGAEHGVQLVDEQDDPSLRRDDLVQGGLQPLLERAAELGARDHSGEVKRDHADASERLRDLVLRDAQGQTLGDRRLADARLADQRRVVLAPTAQGLDHLLDFDVTADHGVDPPRAGLGRQVAAELVQCRRLRTLPGAGSLPGRRIAGSRGTGSGGAWDARAAGAAGAATELAAVEPALLRERDTGAPLAQGAVAALAVDQERDLDRRRALMAHVADACVQVVLKFHDYPFPIRRSKLVRLRF